MKKKELPKVQPVKLKPVLGMKPGVWLTILYSLIIVLFLFFVGVLPDLVNSSKRVTFTSNVSNSAVYLNGKYVGGTTFTTKVNSGSYNVSYRVNGYEIDNFDIKVSKAWFFNWLFPRTMTVSSSKTLTNEAYTALVTEFFEDLSIYSAITSYNEIHRYPNLYTSFANNIKTSLSVAEDYREVMKYSSCFATSDEMVNDCKEAFEILGLSYEEPAEKELNLTKPSWKETKLSVNGIEIKGYSNGSFSVSRTTVTEQLFNEFISENPTWAIENSDELQEENLVDEYYLRGVSDDSTTPVRNISYYSALAFCEWLSTKTGKTVCLPTEEQWMTSCLGADQNYQKSVKSVSKSNNPISMLGGVWEMTSTYYVPVDSEGIQEFLSSYGIEGEMIVKGGSFINSNIDYTTRGSFTKYSCSDYMGFRIIWY